MAALLQQQAALEAYIKSLDDQIEELQAYIEALQKGPPTREKRRVLARAKAKLAGLERDRARAKAKLADLARQIVALSHKEELREQAPSKRIDRARILIPGPCDTPANPCELRARPKLILRPVPPGETASKINPSLLKPGLLENDTGFMRQAPGAAGNPANIGAPAPSKLQLR
jgi:hypothetical protein